MTNQLFGYDARLVTAAWLLANLDLNVPQRYALLHYPTMTAYGGETVTSLKDRHRRHYSDRTLWHIYQWVRECEREGTPVLMVRRSEATEAKVIDALRAEGFTVLNKRRPHRTVRKRQRFSGSDFAGRTVSEVKRLRDESGKPVGKSTVTRAFERYMEAATEILGVLFSELVHSDVTQEETSGDAAKTVQQRPPLTIQRRAPDRDAKAHARGRYASFHQNPKA